MLIAFSAIALDRLDGERGRAAVDEFERDGEKRHAIGERRRTCMREARGGDLEGVGEGRSAGWGAVGIVASMGGVKKTCEGYHANGA